jgi:hypothetical protein
MSDSSLEINKEIISCKNCETEYSGNYCPECGQSKLSFDKPFRFIVADFAGNIFAFDTRLGTTFKTILTKPGQMALEIMKGRRAKYVPPFRLYVFVSFIFFLLLNNKVSNIENEDPLSDATEQNDTNTVVSDSSNLVLDFDVNDSTTDNSEIKFGNRKINFDNVEENSDMYISKFLQWSSSSFFLLMPFYAFLLWIFFRRTYKYYLGHLILAINQHVFTFILLTVLILLSYILPDREFYPELILLLVLPIYYFIGVKEMYKRKWSTTIMRLMVIWSIYFMVSICSFVVLMVYSFSK